MRRIGVLMSTTADDALGQAYSTAFAQGLQQLGWEVGRNVSIEYRWGGGDTERFRRYAAELVASRPDVILGTAASIVGDLQQVSRTVPIVFVGTIDPVGAGLVASLSRPGGNATGFTIFEFSLSAKLLELLKEIAPDVRRVAVVRDPSAPGALPQSKPRRLLLGWNWLRSASTTRPKSRPASPNSRTCRTVG
jgi:putative ABC transport system substrate-binding protein